jgi:hypothetical protein
VLQASCGKVLALSAMANVSESLLKRRDNHWAKDADKP